MILYYLERFVHIIRKSGVKAKTKIQYALLAADPMSGFLKAVAQIYPDKKIASVKRSLL